MLSPEKLNNVPRKRLALFFDGTWNVQGDNTNVWRLSLMLAARSDDGAAQKCFYDTGVGTAWYDRVSGGTFGKGLSENVKFGYRWLMENYDDGDEIFLFGFSRGAFTARSLAGLIARNGILRPDAPMSFMQVYDRYQLGKGARPIYQLIMKKNDPNPDFSLEDKLLLKYSQYRRNLIKLVGVWDTVGSLGVPFGNIKMVSRRTLRFHNTHLSTVVQNSYHALALDEYRSPYKALLWTNFLPDGHSGAPVRDDERMIEQRWFCGAHANVGGGYASDLLSQRPLAWIQQKASGHGLTFRSMVQVSNEDLGFAPTDSYSKFLKGSWKVLTLGRHFNRTIMASPKRTKTVREDGTTIHGWAHTVNERIDESVFLRCAQDDSYCPAPLLEWAKRKKLDLKDVIRSHERFSAPMTRPGIDPPSEAASTIQQEGRK